VHTDGVVEARVTARPEEAEAVTVKLSIPRVLFAKEVKVIDCIVFVAVADEADEFVLSSLVVVSRVRAKTLKS
jgi:hypothetical protein